jgi:hypothetical protein
MSWICSALAKFSITLVSAAASIGVSSPVATASTMAAAAFTASAVVSIRGMSNGAGRSRRGGQRRATQRRIALSWPSFASSITLRVISSPSPSSIASKARVALLRVPGGLPAGLPLCPGWNGISEALPGRAGQVLTSCSSK